MTRTAADVQAAIDALEQASHERSKATLEQVQARPRLKPPAVDQEAIDAINESLRLSLVDLEGIEALKTEHARLARAELDAATPPHVRDLALRLRSAYRGTGHGSMTIEGAWAALETSEAAAWAAVAREAGRG